MDRLLLGISCLLFAVHFVLVFRQVVDGRFGVSWPGLLLPASAFVLQSVVLWERGNHHGRCPITSGFEVGVFLAWSMVLWYFLLGQSYRLSLLGIATSGLAAVAQALVLFAWAPPAPPAQKPVDPWLELHGSLSLLAYGAFGVASLAGLLFIWHDHQLKKRPPPRVFVHLPPINHLFQAMMLVLTLGCALLIAGMVSGYFTVEKAGGLKHGVAYGVLASYAAIVVARWRGLSHRRVAYGAVVGFVLAVSSLWIVS